jgi:hypothetical protein
MTVPQSTTLSHTRLIQRLDAPRGQDNPFSFGGGYKNGGLSDDAMELLRGVFSFDYMGAAEFEFGAVPKALSAIANLSSKGEYAAWSFAPKLRKPDKSKLSVPAHDTIYVVAPRAQRGEIEALITHLANERWNSDLKETTHLNAVLWPDDNWSARFKGWLELDNGFFFFVDEVMFNKVANLFGIESE